MDGRLQIFTGNAHPTLANDIVAELEAPLGRAVVGTWRNGETRVKLEENVRGSDVFVIQSLCDPVNHNIMELLLIIDALRRDWARIRAADYARRHPETSSDTLRRREAEEVRLDAIARDINDRLRRIPRREPQRAADLAHQPPSATDSGGLEL